MEWAMHYRQIVILIATCLVAFGFVALKNINKNEFPNVTIRQGIVVAVYPGATVEEIENQVTKPLENYIFSFNKVKKNKTKSTTQNGMCIIQVELNDDLTNKDEFWSKFRHGVLEFKGSLPSGVLAVVVKDDFGDTSALLITMESNDKTYKELNSYMNSLKDSLQTIESVGRLSVFGMLNEQISVILDNKKLTHYDIDEKIIALNLFQKGFVTTAGTVRNSAGNFPVYVSRSINFVNDIEQLIVYSDVNGNVVKLKDIAEVRREYPRTESFITNNGKKCILLSVEVKPDRNVVAMGQEIYKKIDNFEKTLPDDVKLFRITDQAKVVDDSIVNFLKELMIAVAVVIHVVVLLMPVKVALVAASTIPISIFISLSLFYAFGIELNTVTLAALIVTLGMIVDNSIVIIDSYVEKLSEGMSRWHAAIWSAEHFFKSILSAALAISITFFPFLLTIKGMFHDFLFYFPWSISIVLIVSLLVAELVVPFLQFYLICKPLKTNTSEEKSFSILDAMLRGYDRLVEVCFNNPKLTILCGILSIVLGAFLLTTIPKKNMPEADRNQFAVEIYLSEGSPLEKTVRIADSVENILKQDPDVVSVASFKGCSSPRFHAAYAPKFAGENYAQFVVNTVSNKATKRLVEKYREELWDKFPEAYVRLKQLAYSEIDLPIEIRVYGSDYKNMCVAADSLTAFLRRENGLRFVRSSIEEPLKSYKINVDFLSAQRLGISTFGLEQTLAMRYNSGGLPLTTILDGDYPIPVKVKTLTADSSTVNDIENEKIPLLGGLWSSPLKQFADIAPQWEHSQIQHRGGVRIITITAEIAQGVNAMEMTAQIQKKISQVALPEGVGVVFGGDVEYTADTDAQMYGALSLSVVIIFMIQLFHFRRIRTPFLLLISLTL